MGARRGGALLGARRPPLPEPAVAALLRHRRLVADVRPHVPALRRRRSRRTGSRRTSTATSTRRRSRPTRPCGRRRTSTRRATCRASRTTPSTPAKIGAYLGFVLPHYAGNFLDWWRDRLRPEIERNFAYLDGYDTDAASLVELAVLLRGRDRRPRPPLEDPLDAQLRAVLRDDGAERDDRGGEGRGRPGAPRPPAELGRGPQLGLDRGALADEGGDQGRRRAARGVPGRHRRRRAPRARGLRARPPLPRRAARARTGRSSATRRSGRTSSSFPTWKENPAPIVEAVRGYLETDYDYPAAIAGGPRRPRRRRRRELMDGVPDGEGQRPAPGRRSSSRCG